MSITGTVPVKVPEKLSELELDAGGKRIDNLGLGDTPDDAMRRSEKATDYEVYGLSAAGLAADRPAPGIVDRFYFSTDTLVLERDTGAAWVEVVRGETAIRLAQLAERAHGSLTGVTADQHHAQDHAARHEPGGADTMTVDAVPGTGSLRTLGAGAQQAMPGDAAPIPGAHAASHQDTGADEINVAGLSGLLADDQHVLDAEVLAVAAALVHAARHQNGGADEISIAGLDGESVELATHKAVKAAAATLGHVIVEAGSDIDVDALGKLTLGGHKTRHESGGDDEISVAGLAGLLADDQHVLDAEVLAVAAALVHAARHQNGGADEISIAGLDGESVELATHKAVKAAAAILGHVIVEAGSDIDVDALGKLTLGGHKTRHENGGDDEISIAGLAGEGVELAAHKVATTGIHGVGASTIASVANITTHAGLTTGVHGAGANTLIHSGDTIAALTAPAADFSMNTHKITNVVDPAAAQDAATKAYIDAKSAMLVVEMLQMIVATGTFASDPAGVFDGVISGCNADAVGQYADVRFNAPVRATQWRQYGLNFNNEDGTWKIQYLGLDDAWHDWVTGIPTRKASWSNWASNSEVIALGFRLVATLLDSNGKNHINELEIKY